MRVLSNLTKALVVGALLNSSLAFADTELKVWCWDDNFNVPAARLAAEKFKATHPDVTVKVESIAQESLVQKLNASLGANNVKSLPDVLLIEDYRAKNYIEGYPGFLKDLRGTVNYENFIDSKVAVTSEGDKTYGVPFDSGVTGLFVRRDLFEEAGYKIEDLQAITWDELLEIGKKIKEKTGRKLMTFDINDVSEVRIMMQSAGLWYTKADGKTVNLKDNAAIKEGMLVLKKMHEADILEDVSGWMPFAAAFTGDKVAAVVSGCWLTASIEEGKDLAGKWAVVPIPRLSATENSTNYSNYGGSQWYVNNYSKNKDIAAEFLAQTFGSDKDFINELVPKIGLVTTMKNAFELPNYSNGNEFFGGQKIMSDFVKWSEKIPAVDYGSYSKAIESIFVEALHRVVIDGEDVDAVLADTQNMVEEQLNTF